MEKSTESCIAANSSALFKKVIYLKGILVDVKWYNWLHHLTVACSGFYRQGSRAVELPPIY